MVAEFSKFALQCMGNEVPPKNQFPFILLTSPRSGSEWVMNTINGHPSICSSPISDQIGYPTEALIPTSLSAVPNENINKGCYYAFVRDSVKSIAQNATLASACALGNVKNTLLSEQPWATHLGRLCNIYNALSKNYSDANIFLQWSDAFLSQNMSLLGCACKPGTCVKGLKIMTNWIRKREYADMVREFVSGTKVIRLERKNLFKRYKSFLTATKTGVWHIRSGQSNISAPEEAPSINIDVGSMTQEIKKMESNDRHANKEILAWGSDVLWLTYENCFKSQEECFSRIGKFLGVPVMDDLPGGFDLNSAKMRPTSRDVILSGISNKEEVIHALASNGWTDFLSDCFTKKDDCNTSSSTLTMNESSSAKPMLDGFVYKDEGIEVFQAMRLALFLCFVAVFKLKVVINKAKPRLVMSRLLR